MAKPQYFRYAFVPAEILGINSKKIFSCQKLSRRVQEIQGLMYQFANFTETLIYRAHVGWLLVGALKDSA